MVKARHRITDGILLAVLIRLGASVLRGLTASYATDTVQALTIGCLAFHLVTCDYTYSTGRPTTTKQMNHVGPICSSNTTSGLERGPSGQGNDSMSNPNALPNKLTITSPSTIANHRNQGRPPFYGGTISLNASFLATVLCISRLQSNRTSYAYCALAVVLFGFYPQTRAELAATFPPHTSGTCVHISQESL